MTDGAIFLLAGSGDAPDVVARLRAQGECDVVVWQEAPGRGVPDIPGIAHHGPLPDPAALVRMLRDVKTKAVIDASHAFDVQSSVVAQEATQQLALPLARIVRPKWEIVAPDWREVPNVVAAVSVLKRGAVIFATTGRESLPALRRHDGPIKLRQIIEPGRPTPAATDENVTFVYGQPPFSIADEQTLFRKLGVDQLIFRNTGGSAGRSKVDAARASGLPVVFIDRPVLPEAHELEDAVAACEWVRGI